MMSFQFAPKGWALCNGQLLPILFSLLGTTFGGDGASQLRAPDLRARAPIHVGTGHTLRERGGEQAHPLSIAELPTHTHVAMASPANANAPAPGGRPCNRSSRTAIRSWPRQAPPSRTPL